MRARPSSPSPVWRRAVAATVVLAAASVPVGTVLSRIGDPAGAADPARPLVISEYRLRGLNGPNDEFIEITNVSATDHVVAATSGAGYGVAASDGATRCAIPNGTTIPAFGSFLCVNSIGYSLAAYPGGVADATYAVDVPTNAGVALFDNLTGGASYTADHRLDAVGSTAEANPLYREGAGHPPVSDSFSLQGSFVRNLSTASVTDPAPTTATPGVPEDTDDNATDLYWLDTNGSSIGAGQRLGAPGPQSSTAPRTNGNVTVDLLDPCSTDADPPNAVRDFTPDPAHFSSLGTVDVRRTYTNSTGGAVTRLRFRVADIRTFPAPSGIADLRPRTSGDLVTTVDRAPCGSGLSNVSLRGTSVEQPPDQPSGGGFGTTFSVPSVSPANPLAADASIDVRFLLGVQQLGSGGIRLIPEVSTTGPGDTTPAAGDCLWSSAGADTPFPPPPDLCAVADPPVAVADAYSTAEDTPLVEAAPGVLGNDTDPDTAPSGLTATLVDDVGHGSLILDADGSFTYTPDPDFNGSDTFTYVATDGVLDSAPATVTIAVGAGDDVPIGGPDGYEATSAVPLVVATPGVLANDVDPDGDALTATLDDGPAFGTVALDPDGSFTYTANPGFDGIDTFTYRPVGGGVAGEPVPVDVDVTFAVPPTPPEADGSLVLSDDTVTRGQVITASGAGMEPGETVRLVLYSEPALVATAEADADGEFSAELTVPAAADLGDHTLVAYGGVQVLDDTLTVLVPDPSDDPDDPSDPYDPYDPYSSRGSDGLARTGTDVRAAAWFGVVLVGLGGLALVAAHRGLPRRPRTP